MFDRPKPTAGCSAKEEEEEGEEEEESVGKYFSLLDLIPCFCLMCTSVSEVLLLLSAG